MSTYSSLVESSKAFERLFKILHKVFLVMTIVLAVLGSYSMWYLFGNRYDKDFEWLLVFLYVMSPAIITLVLTIASYIAAKLVFNIRLKLPVDDKK